MTAKDIEEQIIAIREATEKASVSPEAALEFLRRAGIVSADKNITAKQSTVPVNNVSSIKTK